MTAVLEELRSLLILLVGAAMAIVGAKINDELIRGMGMMIVGTALGITVPGLPRRDSTARTRTTDDPERQQSGR